MGTIEDLKAVWAGCQEPFLVSDERNLRFSEILAQSPIEMSSVKPGDVVAIIGDFDPLSIQTLLRLIELGAIVVPLTVETRSQHEYFFDAAKVDVVAESGEFRRLETPEKSEPVEALRAKGHAGLVLFSTGTTGRPKAILHDMTLFLRRFGTPRPSLRTMNFLLFDHIGGLNTLLHTLYNRGVVVVPKARTVDAVLETCAQFDVEALPTTPTFLRMMLMSGAIPDNVPKSLKIITYGTERMDQPTLSELCRLLPDVDFRQTFGMSELGILRVKSKARDSLFMRVGGKGVETKVVGDILFIRSQSRMIGYLNAPSPFDDENWYNTGDVVETDETEDSCYKVVGRKNDVINVGGLKFMAAEVELVALEFPNVSLVKAYAKDNPITGQHVEIDVQPRDGETVDKKELRKFMKQQLQPHMVPRRFRIGTVAMGHRFKKM